MASLKYFIQSKEEQSSINLRLSIGRGAVYKRATGFITSPKKWSNVKGAPVGRDVDSVNLKFDLNKLKEYIEIKYNESRKTGENIDGHWLKEMINEFTNTAPDVGILSNFIDDMLESAGTRRNQRGGHGLSNGRIKVYRTFRLLMERYDPDLLISKVDLRYAERFQEWNIDQGYSPAYMNKNLKLLKFFAKESGNYKLKDLQTYRIKKSVEEIMFLSKEEQQMIADAKITSVALDNARKWLLLGCLLGQRGGDLLSLTEDRIRMVGDVSVIDVVQQKTGKQVVVPILPKALELIEDGFPYPISLGKLNKHLKEVCRIAKLNTPALGLKRQGKGKGSIRGTFPKWEIVGSHICRRSFATNFYGRIPTPVLIGVTGHGTEEMFLKYIGKSSMDNAMQMVEYFNKL